MNKLLLVMIALLALILGYQWQFTGESSMEPEPQSIPRATQTNEQSTEPVTALGSVPMSNFEEVVLRPLFIEGRRPPPEPDDEVAEETVVVQPRLVRRPLLNLTAVLIIENQRFAVFRGVGKKQDASKLKLGDEVEGWTVSKIEPKQVTLKLGDSEEIYLLREYGKVPLPSLPLNPAEQQTEPTKGAQEQPPGKQAAPAGNK